MLSLKTKWKKWFWEEGNNYIKYSNMRVRWRSRINYWTWPYRVCRWLNRRCYRRTMGRNTWLESMGTHTLTHTPVQLLPLIRLKQNPTSKVINYFVLHFTSVDNFTQLIWNIFLIKDVRRKRDLRQWGNNSLYGEKCSHSNNCSIQCGTKMPSKTLVPLLY